MMGVLIVLGLATLGALFFGAMAWLGDRHLEKARRGMDAQGRKRVGL